MQPVEATRLGVRAHGGHLAVLRADLVLLPFKNLEGPDLGRGRDADRDEVELQRGRVGGALGPGAQDELRLDDLAELAAGDGDAALGDG